MTSVETRTFGVTAGEIEAIDQWVEEVGARWCRSERTVFAARLCIAELAANVLEHGVPNPGHDCIRVTLRSCDDGIAVEFMDSRHPFDPTGKVAAAAATGADPSRSRGRGHGLRFLHAYSEGLAYRHDGILNRLVFTVRSKGRAGLS